MENWWMNKCDASLPPPSSSQEQRSQMENVGYLSCQRGSQDLRAGMLGRLQDPLLPGIQTSEQANLGNSFVSMPSGSPSLLQRAYLDFSSSQSICSAGRILQGGSNSIFNGTQGAIPVSSTGTLSDELSWTNRQSGADFSHNGSSKLVLSSICASNSVLHDVQSSDLANVVICHTGPANKKPESSYVSSKEWRAAGTASRENFQISERVPSGANSFISNQASRVFQSASPADSWKVHRENMHASQRAPIESNSVVSYHSSSVYHGTNPADNGKACRAYSEKSPKIPVEAYSFASNEASSLMIDCPRVFCLATSGYLLLSNTGHLGIVCACHSFRMSAFKFCEHSGLYGVNPGDVIRMDNGETIAQWCKLNLSNIGIRIPGEKSEWDWPQELSATASWMNQGVPIPKISNISTDLVFSGGGSVTCKESFDGVLSSKSPIACQSFANSSVLYKPEGNSEDRHNPFLKALTGTSQNNLQMANKMTMQHAMKTSKLVGNGAEDGCQLISAYTGSPLTRSPSAHPSLLEQRNEKLIGKGSDFYRVEKTRDAISNIELRLGQPYQLAQTSGNTDISGVGRPLLLGTVVNPMKSLFPQQINTSGVKHRDEVEFMQCDRYSSKPSNPRRNREWNRLNQDSNSFVTRNGTEDERAQYSVPFLTNLKSPSKESKPSIANNYMLNASGNTMRNSLHCVPLPDENNVNSVWGSGGNSERQLDMLHLGSYKLIDSDKGLSFDADASHLAKCKEMEVSSSFNMLRGNGNPNFSTTHGNSCYSYQLCGTSDSKISPYYPEKVISSAGSGQVDHVYLRPVSSSMGSEIPTHAVSNGFPVSASTSSTDPIAPFCRQEFVGVHTHLRDDILQVHSTRQVQEISKLTSPSKKQVEGRFGFSSYMQQSHIDTSASGKQSHKLSPGKEHDFSEAGSHPSDVTCRIETDKDTASPACVNCCCQFSQPKQGNALNCKQVSLNQQTSIVPCCPKQPSPSEKTKDVPKLSKHERCCHKEACGNFHGSSSHATYRNCLEINSESRVGSSPTVSKVQKGSVNSEASAILSPQFAGSHLIPNVKNVSLDHTRKLTGEVPKNKAYHNSQWRDVPSKARGVSDVKRVDRLANLFDATKEDREKLGDTCMKCLNGTVQITDSLKEHGASNISSGCYARVISQSSVEFANMESSTNDSWDHGCGSNLVIDQGSSIDKTWSSDDAPESKKSAKLLASTSFSLKKVEPPKNLRHESSSCLLDDIKLLNSLTWQKSRDQILAGFNLLDKDKHHQNLKKDLKIGKRKRELGLKLNASCSNSSASPVRQENLKSDSSSQFTSQPSKSLMMSSRKSGTDVIGNCITQSSSKPRLHVLSPAKKLLHRSDLHKVHTNRESEVSSVFQKKINVSTTNHELPEVSGGKTSKRNSSSNAFRKFQKQESGREDANRTKINSVDGFKSTFSEQVNIGHLRSKPIVCGIYGELTDGSSTGRISKPAKLVPLSRVLSSSPRCIVPKHRKSKSSSMMKRKHDVAVICDRYDLKTEKYKNCRYAKNEDTSKRKRKKCSIGERGILKEPASLEKQSDIQSEKDQQKLDDINHTQLQMKPKEIRKRSIYEFTGKEEHLGSEKSSVSKISNFRPVKEGKPVATGEGDSAFCQNSAKISTQEHKCHNSCDSAPVCCVCGSSNQDEINNLLECYQCSIRVHQACYGVSKVPKDSWSCRPCRTSSKDIVCVLCGYGGGGMTRALRSQTIVVSLLRAWNVEIGSGPKNELFSVKTLQKESTGLQCSNYRHSPSSFHSVSQPESDQPMASAHCKSGMADGVGNFPSFSKTKVHNSITMGLVDVATKQWLHMVCGLWTSETRCPNVHTMSAFDVSGVPLPSDDVVCCMCKRAGGSCIQCRVENCYVRFHPWCAHLKGLLQTEVEGVDNENVGFYGRCEHHATHPIYKSDYTLNTEDGCLDEKKLLCARTEGYKGRKRDGFRHNYCDRMKSSDGCVPQEQLNAWAYINGQKPCTQEFPKLAISEIEHDTRKEYVRYKQAKLWKHLVVYKSDIHALGLYTPRFISRDEMVVEYVGEIVGQRVSDKRENEYQSAKKLQYKSACYFFRIDKEHIVDATCKGGIGRFVNHSCSPNCVAKVISVRNEKKVVFLAERDIFPGEEITYDYHFNHEDEGKKIPCYCNSKYCRRYLN